MGYVVALTKLPYQYKISIPRRLVESSGWEKERVLVLSECGDGSILMTKFREGINGSSADRKPRHRVD